MVDVLYILGKGSQYNNLELRLSLRSLEENCEDISKVYIVGYKPDWIKNIIHIEEEDNLEREKNAFKKILKACKSGISDNFLFMNDDFYMIRKFKAIEYPYFINGDIRFVSNPSRWQEIFNKTIVYLQSKGIEQVKDFCVHCPVLYNKKKFLSLKSLFEKSIDAKCGYSPRLLYGNLFVKDYKRAVDCKLWDITEIKDNEQGCVSTKDDCDEVLEQLKIIFSKKSKYEKRGIDD